MSNIRMYTPWPQNPPLLNYTSNAQVPQFTELPNSGGVKALDLRIGDGDTPLDGDVVAIHYYGRLAAKQGWRFDSTYDHKDESGEPIPFSFILGSGKVISGIESAVRSMKVGSLRRVIIPPSQGYQNASQEPLPPNYFDRQRLFTTIFNPTRLANGEGATLGTVIFDIELVSLRHL
ncbi:peptidyl-prolyl cis-trans isomerase FKBP17-1, chloroplastic [Nicotiana tomentosiformis]|uniref:peptidyl-prolyl cis-trans isomerase FKBP17-1, chloroplastic n=1 Tax=Nicotiana tomentosiformis TaxID=4098 RepID=UPI00051BA1E5|nr:peptidyl-prolyl cis-trans isomerase FKBP17-1, chloroplastic [Nicotiana tomentosiformis]